MSAQTTLPPDDLIFPSANAPRDLKHLSIRGGTVTMIAQAVRFFLQLAATIVLARLLTPEDYGLFSIAFSIIIFVSLFKDLGLATASTQRAEIRPDELTALFWVNAAWGVVLAMATVIAAPGLAAFFHEPRLTEMLRVMATLSILAGISIQHWALLNRRLRFTSAAFIEVLAMALGTTFGIVAAWRGLGYWSLVLTQVVIAAIRAGGGIIAVRWLPAMPRAVSIRAFLAFGGHLTGVGVLAYVTRNLDNVLIGWLRGARELGFYDKAYQMLLLPIVQINFPIGALSIAVLSRLAQDALRYRDYFTRILLICASLGMPLIAFLFVAAEPVVQLMLGDAWLESVPLFRALAPAAFVDTFTSALAWMLISLGQTARQLRAAVVVTIVLVLGLVSGAPWGAFGIGIAYSLCRVGVALPHLVYACAHTPVSWRAFLNTLARPAFASISAALLLALLRTWLAIPDNLWLTVFAMSAAYSIFYPAFWVGLPGGRKMLAEIWRLAGTLRSSSNDPLT